MDRARKREVRRFHWYSAGVVLVGYLVISLAVLIPESKGGVLEALATALFCVGLQIVLGGVFLFFWGWACYLEGKGQSKWYLLAFLLGGLGFVVMWVLPDVAANTPNQLQPSAVPPSEIR